MANNLSCLVFLVIVATCMGCSPLPNYKPPEIAYKIKHSDIVVYGIPRKVQHDPNFPEVDSTVQVVDFEVRCIFKGAPVKENIRIFEAGHVPGLCHSTNLTVDAELIVYLKRNDDGKLTPTFGEDSGGEAYRDELIFHCEITTVDYPVGRDNDNNRGTCPEAVDHGDLTDCVPVPPEPTVPEPPIDPITGGNGPSSPPLPPAEMPGQKESEDKSMSNPSQEGAYKAEDNTDAEGKDKTSVKGPNGGANNIVLHVSTLLIMLFSAFALL